MQNIISCFLLHNQLFLALLRRLIFENLSCDLFYCHRADFRIQETNSSEKNSPAYWGPPEEVENWVQLSLCGLKIKEVLIINIVRPMYVRHGPTVWTSPPHTRPYWYFRLRPMGKIWKRNTNDTYYVFNYWRIKPLEEPPH